MKKIIPLSLIAVASIYAAEVELAPIGVESTIITEVSQKAQTSADLADALSKNVPSIDMNRRSGIANDIYIRGQKRDNISIEVDGTKVCGACPNRMDPPTSHILASQIDDIEVIEGPYDVETYGVMSGGIKVTTKKPTKDFNGELNLGFGSWGYKKFGGTLSGGNDFIRVLISGSTESSDQYRDGNGDTMAEQLENDPAAGTSVYSDDYKEMEAYKKKSIMTKAFINVTDDQELRLSYTANRSDNVLYPNSKMDAIYDDSDIFSAEYIVNNITDVYKNASLQYYYSKVDHPMGTDYREAGEVNYMTSQLQTTMEGLKLKNNFDFDGNKVLFGLDGSERTWDGHYYKNGNIIPDSATKSSESMDRAVTKNAAVFAKLDKSIGDLDLSVGARYDSTKIKNDEPTQQDNKYKSLNANIFASYNLNKENRIFFGLGQAYRVPDARELYFVQNSPMPMPAGTIKVTGTDDLEQTKNQQLDLGYELSNDVMNFKIKGFYSKLSDYIYYNSDLAQNNFVNIDAKIYGGEIDAEYYVTDTLTVDAGVSYKRGKKDKALEGQSDRDLADIAPLRGSLGVSYEYMSDSSVSAEILASKKWTKYDEDNSEQELNSWAILNLKANYAVNKKWDISLGVNNVFDKTYAVSNTYADLILITSGATDTMLMNEPGRYVYTNMTFKF